MESKRLSPKWMTIMPPKIRDGMNPGGSAKYESHQARIGNIIPIGWFITPLRGHTLL